MKLLIMRTPDYDDEFYRKICRIIEKLEYDLTGFIAWDKVGEVGRFEGYPVYPFANINSLNWDIAILCCSDKVLSKAKPIFEKLNIPSKKIKNVWWLLQQLMAIKYEDSGDKVIQDTLKYWKTHELSVFNQHMEGVKDTLNEVFFDDDSGYPYILFDTVNGKKRRLYYPKDDGGAFQKYEGKDYVPNILREQVPTSPHLYITGEHKIKEGDVLIDAGVCEGNFALRYVDICSKVYLFEMDQKWWEPLYHSFKDCWDKVELITKPCSDATSNGGGGAAIDDVVRVPKNSNIFLKMDIEGAETSALHGAKNILSNYNVKASVCSYHKSNDAIKIKSIFQNHNYKTWTSAGYMIFIYDSKIWDTADFRKGIVYAENY